jgi:hypothetical protein
VTDSDEGDQATGNSIDTTPLRKLLSLDQDRARQPSKVRPLESLLSDLGAPPDLPGLLKIAQNVLEILDPKTAIPLPESESYDLAGWREERKRLVFPSGL